MLTRFLGLLNRRDGTKKLPQPPLAMVTDGEELLEVAPNAVQIIFDQSFFSSMIKMDYNTDGASQIVCHASW